MNQSTIHPADCTCSKCPGHFSTRKQHHRRFLVYLIVYMAILVAAGSAAIIATAAR